MRRFLFALFLTIPLHSQVTGLGRSSIAGCKIDKDGDGYGEGPAAITATDLVIAAGGVIVSSASYTFTQNDMLRSLTITSGTGFHPPGTYCVTATNTSAGTATLGTSPGTAGSTGGHYSMAGCLGADADDTDPQIHSTADVISAYGSVNAFLIHLGYQFTGTPVTVWDISPTGSDSNTCHSTNADTARVSPCATYQHVMGLVSVPYIVMAEGGMITSSSSVVPVGGTSSNRAIIMATPGQRPFYIYTGSVADDIIQSSDISPSTDW